MIKQHKIFVIACVLFSLSAGIDCNKQVSRNWMARVVVYCPNKIHTTIQTMQDGSTITNTFTYEDANGNGRLTKMESTSSTTGKTTTTTFDYSITGKVIETFTPSSSPPITFTLNDQGLAISDDRSGGGATYTYDNNSFCVQSIYPGYEDDRTIQNDNISLEKQIFSDPSRNTQTSYVPDPSTACADNGMWFLGSITKNFHLSQVVTDANGNATTTNYINEKDSNGRVSKQTRTGGINDVVIYTYY